MSLDLIFRVVCFFMALKIGILEGSYLNIAICNIRKKYNSARYACMDAGGSGTLLTLATFNLHEELITHELRNRSQKEQTFKQFWIQKTQGLFSQNASSTCNTNVDRCPYIEMNKGNISCNESHCNRTFSFLCESDSPYDINDCIIIPLKDSSSQSYIKENTTLFYSNDVPTSITATESFAVRGTSTFLYPVVICLVLSLLFLLSTIPVALKRRLAQRKRKYRKRSVINADCHHEISLGYSEENSVDETSSKFMTYTTVLKETGPVNTTNVYSVFSVQSSVYNKLNRSRKRSRKNDNNDNSIYSSLNGDRTKYQNSEVTSLNAQADGVHNGITSFENRKDDVSCNEASSRRNGEYSLAKVISMESEDSKIVLMDTVQRNTMRRNTMPKSSSLPSTIVTSAEDYELAGCVPVHYNLRSQSCEVLDYEMARFAPINDFRSVYPFIAVCKKKCNYRTAQYTCTNMEGSGTLLTKATFYLHKEWIIEELKKVSQRGKKYWINKTQGLLSQNASSACNTQVDKCPYIEKKKGKVKYVCNELSCNRKFFFLCENDSPFNNTDCVGMNRPLLNTSTQSNIEENTTEFHSDNATNRMTPTQSSKIEGSSPFMFPVLICLTLSLLFLLSTIPAVMKRRMARRKRKQSVKNGNRYHEILLDYLQAKSVHETPSKSMTNSAISGLKETAPVNTTNVYSVFSVQNSIYNKLKRSLKRSRKNDNNDNSIYSPLNVSRGTDQNATADGDNNGIMSLKNPTYDISCNEASSRQNCEYSHAEVISMESEDSKILFMDTVQRNTMLRNTMRKSSSLPSAIVTSAKDYELARCVPVHCNLRSQSCEIGPDFQQ